MSGGVDSSAAAALLKEQGHELVGFTMQLWNQRRHINVDENGDPLPSRCCSLDDVYDARRVAESLGMPFYVLNLEKDFERDVVNPFVESYLNGETPIPCVACNSRLKFASLDKLAQSLDCDKVATGHYARVEYDEAKNRYRLFRGKNHWKDQTYFLWELTQDQLSRAYFPLGEMMKSEVRELAREADLYVADKQESQEICFVPDGNYSGFIDRFLEHENRENEIPEGGEIVNAKGEKIGEHTGIHRYTIGQRRGLGIANEKPLYVVQIERAKNQIIAGEKAELNSCEFFAKGVNWVAFDEPANPFAPMSKCATATNPRPRRFTRLPTIAPASSSTNRKPPSRPDKQPFSTTAKNASAAAGLKKTIENIENRFIIICRKQNDEYTSCRNFRIERRGKNPDR